MAVVPACENKPLSDCGLGNLVRPLGHWRRAEFAINGTIEDEAGCALLLFGNTKPSYITITGTDRVSVLDYGDGWFLDVDVCGPFEPPIRQMYEASGCLIREKSRWLINVRADDGRFAYQRAQFDLTNRQLIHVSNNLDNIAVFGKWGLYLGNELRSRDTWRKIAAFEWTAREGQRV